MKILSLTLCVITSMEFCQWSNSECKNLNHSDERFPTSQAKIIDVCAIPSFGGISELELMAILDEVIPKYTDVKIWNLSLGTNDPCQDQRFSDLAIYLDDYKIDLVLHSYICRKL